MRPKKLMLLLTLAAACLSDGGIAGKLGISRLSDMGTVQARETIAGEDGDEIIHIYFTYHFETNGGDALDDLVCDNYVSEMWVLPTPVRRGYNFRGWYTDITLTQKYDYSKIPETGTTLTLYAKWEKVTGVSNETIYTISYELAGGYFAGVYPTQFRSGDVVDIPAPVREDYVFDGWYLDSSYVQKFAGSLGEIGSITLYAKWKEVGSIPITYVLNGGTLPDDAPTSFKYGKNTNLVSPTRIGYNFLGWFIDEALTKPFTTISGGESGITLYASWEKKTVSGTDPADPEDVFATFILHANGGTVENTVYTIGQGETLILPVPVRTGYTFDGWYMDAALTRRIGSGGLTQGTYDLYAKWTQDVYNILLVLNGTTLPGGTVYTYTYDGGFVLPTPTTSSASLTFTGWYYDRTLKQKCTGIAPKTSTGSITLYAGVVYNGQSNVEVQESETDTTYSQTVIYTDPETGETQITSSITLKTNGIYYDNLPDDVENPNPKVVAAGDTIVLKSPKRKHYRFLGWYADDTFKKKVTTISFDKDVSHQKVYAKWQYMYLNLKKFSVSNKKKGTFTCKWGKLKDAEGYQIQISLNKKYKSAKKYKTKTYTYSKKKTSANIKKLKKGKKYYIRIRSFAKDSTGKRCYSDWSICEKPLKVYK